jgi:hypothetical protein
MKAIQMKLTLEEFVFCLPLKIARHHSSGEYIGQVDSESLSMGLPQDNDFIADLSHLFKYIMDFAQKPKLH